MKEGKIEAKLVRYCRKKGVLCYKFNSPSRAGVPDRILVFKPTGKVIFLELKATGAKPTPLQVRELKLLADHGADAYCLDTFEACASIVDNLIRDPHYRTAVIMADYRTFI